MGSLTEQRQQAAARCAAEVCHDHQLVIWSGEVAAAIEPYVRDPLSYDDVISLRRALEVEIERIVATAFEMSESR